MSASLVGSEMCIRDRSSTARALRTQSDLYARRMVRRHDRRWTLRVGFEGVAHHCFVVGAAGLSEWPRRRGSKCWRRASPSSARECAMGSN
eukprot:10169449-Alexandrium_andersonii.AAC.1